jgi:hypothetical protein
MKKLFTLMTFSCLLVAAKAQFGADVYYNTNANNHVNTEVSTAFNGWIYTATSVEDPVANKGGIEIRKSIDGGLTWEAVDFYFTTGIRYPTHDIVVTGTDSASLKLHLVGVNYNVGSDSYVLFIDTYNGVSGAFTGSTYNLNKGTNKVYDVEISSDYKNPAVGSSPYAVGVLYSSYTSSLDSLNSIVSMDGGATYTNRQVVATTGGYFRNVSLDYGRSTSASNGRFFAAWERLSSSTNRTGNIYTSRNASTVDGSWITPENLDSLSATMANLCRNPRIAVQQSLVDNDSGSVTAIVTLDRDYVGDGSDYDMLGFYNNRAHFTNFWYRFDVVNSTENDMYSDVVYEDVNQQFHLAFLDSTNHQLKYLTNTMQFTDPNTWTNVYTGINDTLSMTQSPKTRIAFRPVINELAVTWVDTKTDGRGIAKIDVENFAFIGLAELNQSDLSLFPNPVSELMTIRLDEALVNAAANYRIVDINGRLVESGSFDQNAQIGINVSAYTNGVYLFEVTTDLGKITKRFVKK